MSEDGYSVRSVLKLIAVRSSNSAQPWRLQMKQRKIVEPIFGFIFALLAIVFSQAVLGQAVNGTLLGTVTDPSGAVVSNAKVTIVLTGQSVSYSTVTNASGDFTEPDLPSGTYTVSVVAQGFKKETWDNIALATNT